MWLARCWGQAVSSVAELEVGWGGGKKLGGERERQSEAGPDRAWEQSQRPGISGIA